MDEFPFALTKRFNNLGIENTEENRRRYRELLITSDNIEKYINGVIFYDATLFQKTKDGELFVDILRKKGVVPGIKVDEVEWSLMYFICARIVFFVAKRKNNAKI